MVEYALTLSSSIGNWLHFPYITDQLGLPLFLAVGAVVVVAFYLTKPPKA
ncbi:MAG TPA: hypothetical protein VMJ66_17565 [Geobacteraceae bacterium]|nr:hypothetical protein [Geobacteraceae bacterium]